MQSGVIYREKGTSGFGRTFYPDLSNHITTIPDIDVPFQALFLPTRPNKTLGTMQEARLYPLAPGETSYLYRFRNRSAETATLTVKILRVWG